MSLYQDLQSVVGRCMSIVERANFNEIRFVWANPVKDVDPEHIEIRISAEDDFNPGYANEIPLHFKWTVDDKLIVPEIKTREERELMFLLKNHSMTVEIKDRFISAVAAAFVEDLETQAKGMSGMLLTSNNPAE